MDKLLTIIIPAYNMEKYLHRCLDSIICSYEIMEKVQVIVINDGSKDSTSEIAHQYERKYPHYIHVIDKDNGNYGSCMNVGLSLAKGKYFRTLDADDWYNTEAYEKFVKSLSYTNADMLICERFTYNEKNNKNLRDSFKKGIITNTDLPINAKYWKEASILQLQNVNCICYKTSILKVNHFSWSENVYYSDTEYDYFPLSHIHTIRFLPYPVYCYFIGRNDQSVSEISIKKNFCSFFIVSKKILEDFVKNSKKESAVYLLQRHHLIRILRFVYQSLLFDGEKNISKINEIENLIKKQPDLETSTSYIDVYRHYYYVYEFRHNKLKYTILRIDYKLRNNRLLRSILGKDIKSQ